MDISNPPGLQAHVDDQGPHPNCTIHAVSKALTEVCDSLGIDVNQDQITSDLKCQHAKGTGMFATQLNMTTLEVQEEGTTNRFFLTASIKSSTLGEMKSGQGISKYVVNWKTSLPPPDNLHCVYAKQWLPLKGKVKCLNSWGDNFDPIPLIDPGEISKVYAVDLILRQSQDQQLVAASFFPADKAAADVKKDELPQEARNMLDQLLNEDPVRAEIKVRCHCGEVSDVRVGRWPNNINNGRKFFMCDQRPRACKFFLWKEEEVPTTPEAHSTTAAPYNQTNMSKETSSCPPMGDRAVDVKMMDSTTEVSNKNPMSDEASNQTGRNQQKKGGRKGFNVFVAIELDNSEILGNMQQVQDYCVEKDASIAKHKLPLEKAHVTLLVSHVEEENLPKAKAAIDGALQEVVSTFPDNKFQLEIKGVGNFGNKTVFAKVGAGASFLKHLNRSLLKKFESMGFESNNRFDVPHSTFLKVVQGHEEIPPELYSKFSQKTFGSIMVQNIKLLSMSKKPTPEGRYHCEGDFLFKDVSTEAAKTPAHPQPEEAVRCDCGVVATLRTGRWKNSINTGRKFYMCDIRPKACNFFLWEDERVARPRARVIREPSQGAEARPSEASGSNAREARDSSDELLTLAMKLSEEEHRIETMKMKKNEKKVDKA